MLLHINNISTENAEKLVSSYYGYGWERLGVDLYSYSVGGVSIMQTMTKYMCYPVSMYMGIPNFGFFNIGFLAFRPYISNQLLFNMPPECENVAVGPVEA